MLSETRSIVFSRQLAVKICWFNLVLVEVSTMPADHTKVHTFITCPWCVCVCVCVCTRQDGIPPCVGCTSSHTHPHTWVNR